MPHPTVMSGKARLARCAPWRIAQDVALSPTRCLSCRAFALKAIATGTTCECGGALEVLVGGEASYTSADHSLFDAVVATLYTALTPATAGKLLQELQACGERSPLFKLGWLAQLAPALSVIELIASADLLTAHKAVSMIGTVLEAMRKDGRASGFVASSGDSRQKGGGRG